MVSNKTSNRRAVSPIVAVLILIVVAVVGGGAVAVLMGNITSQTSQQASSQAVANKSSSVLNIGGSTTVYPVTEAMKSNFTASTGIGINDAQGGSGAGMVGVDQGVLDIGAASSIKAYNDEVAKDPTANLKSTLIGGSGVIMVVKGTGTGGQLSDGTTDCLTISSDMAQFLWTAGGGPYFTPTCDATTHQLTKIVAHTTATTTHDIQVFGRTDLPSGTVDQFMAWAFQDNTKNSNNMNGSFTGVSGNPGAQAAVTAVNTANNQGIAFFDAGINKNSAGNALLAIPGMQSTKIGVVEGPPGTYTGVAAAVPATAQTGVAAGSSMKALETNIKNSLKGTVNFPGDTTDPTVQSSRTFYYVTKGLPTASEQSFIDFARSTNPVVQDAFHINGYYSIYDFK